MLLLVGCSRDNPWFALEGGDDTPPPGSTGAADEGDTTGPAASTSPMDTTASTGPADTSGDTGSVVDTGSDTGSDSDDTTTGELHGTTTDIPDMTDTGGDDTTTGLDPTEGELWHDLWMDCAAPGTHWLAESLTIKPIECDTDGTKPAPPWAGWHPKLNYKGETVTQVLALVPEFGAGPLVTGTYDGLTMPGAKTPHLRTTVLCPTDPPGCLIKGNIRIEQGAVPVVGIEDFKLSSGQAFDIDIDLTPYQTLRDGSEFSLVLVVTSMKAVAGNRGLWLAPRIVEVNP